MKNHCTVNHTGTEEHLLACGRKKIDAIVYP
jgi:hypothetical protein